MPQDRTDIQSPTGVDPAPPNGSLDQAVRALIGQELAKRLPPQPGTPASEGQGRKATSADAFWFLVFIVDSVLALLLFPRSWLKDPLWEFLSKLVPWLSCGLFFAGATWLKENVPPFTRTAIFKILLLVWLAAGGLRLCPLLLIQPKVKTAGAKLLLDDKEVDPGKTIRLALQNHKVKVVGLDDAGKNTERNYVLTTPDLLGTLWRDNNEFWWSLPPLLGNTDITARNKGVTVQISKTDGSLPNEFESSGPLIRDSNTKLHLVMPPDAIGFPIKLPLGSYQMFAVKGDCKSKTQTRQVGPGDNPGVEFEELPCT